MPRSDGDAAALAQLLDARNEHPESLAEIDGEIWRRFGAARAVLVLDMCGFSRLTMRHGVVHFLAMIRRLGRLVRPVVEAEGGRIVKAEADDVIAIFPDAVDAVDAAAGIHDALATANTFLPDDWDLHAGIGIGFGRLLLIGADDLYGAEMNLASKLGEDVAGPGDTLLTAAARAQLGADAPPLDEVALEVAGLSLTAFKLDAGRR